MVRFRRAGRGCDVALDGRRTVVPVVRGQAVRCGHAVRRQVGDARPVVERGDASHPGRRVPVSGSST